MTTVTYHAGWHRAKNKPLAEISVDMARERHESGAYYVAVIRDDSRPRCVLEINLGAGIVQVLFWDAPRDAEWGYNFVAQPGSRVLLLSDVHYSPPQARPFGYGGVMWLFKPQSPVVMRIAYPGPTPERVEIPVQHESTELVERFPAFGEYEGLARFPRKLPEIAL